MLRDVCNAVTEVDDALVVRSLSFCVTLVSSPDIAVLLVLILVFALLTDVVKEVIDDPDNDFEL